LIFQCIFKEEQQRRLNEIIDINASSSTSVSVH